MTDDDSRTERALRSLHLAVQPAVTAPSPAAVRRRAERRTVRRIATGVLAAAAAVAATVGLGAALNPADRVPVPPAPPPTASTPAASTPASSNPPSLRTAVLEPAHLGAGYSVDSERPTSGTSPGELIGATCAAGSAPATPAAAHVRDGYSVLFKAPRGHYDGHEVWRFDDESRAASWMQELRDWLRVCARTEEEADPGVIVVAETTTLASGFAGTESLAIRLEMTRNGAVSNVDHYVVVRQGDLIGTLSLSDQRWTEPQLLAVGRTLAARLCAANATC